MSKKVKRGFFSCAVVTILAFLLLLGGTAAWFQDSKIVINTYTFGNLDVDIQHKGSDGVLVGATTLNFAKAYDPQNGVYNEGEYLFEPGATFRLEDIYIANKGDVDFQYRIELDQTNAVRDESKPNLMDAMDVYIKMGDENLAGATGTLAAGQTTATPIRISIHMKEDAGNEYQNLSVSNICVKVYAVQEGVTIDEALAEEN